MNDTKHLHPSQRLILLRQNLGLTQRELAKEFQVSPGSIAHWETGTHKIPGPVIKLIDLYEQSFHSSAYGALSSNIHGRGLKMRPMIDDVESFTLIGTFKVRLSPVTTLQRVVKLIEVKDFIPLVTASLILDRNKNVFFAIWVIIFVLSTQDFKVRSVI